MSLLLRSTAFPPLSSATPCRVSILSGWSKHSKAKDAREQFVFCLTLLGQVLICVIYALKASFKVKNWPLESKDE